MKNARKKYFTLVEIMITIGILVVLMSISWVAGGKVLKSTKIKQMKAEISMLVTAVEQYKTRWGAYPFTSTGGVSSGESALTFDFGEKLSSVAVGAGYTTDRPMYIDFLKQNIYVDNEEFADTDATATEVEDPYENPYQYKYDDTTNEFIIYSVGLDGGDDHGVYNPGNDEDDISSNNL